MKTSNKLIVLALLIIIVALPVYDFLLKAEYETGNYKIPFQNYSVLAWKDFDVVELNSSTAVNVKFVQGPFSVRMDSEAKEYTHIEQHGNHLQINAQFDGTYQYNRNTYVLLISCPRLTRLYANASYLANQHQVTDSIVRPEWKMRQVLIDGFKQDSLTIEQDYGSTVLLANNTIPLVRADIGKSDGSGSVIALKEGNQFGDMMLNLAHRSKLELDNNIINHLFYHLSDSAKLVVSGKAHHLLSHLNPSHQ